MTSDLGHRAGSATTAELRTAAALRWQRPLLTSELAGHACARAVADGDDLRWAQSAGWLLDGYAAGGDARDVATAVLGGLTGTGRSDDAVPAIPARPPGGALLDRPEATRLRVELAAVAQVDGELETAHALVAGLPDDGPGEEPGLLRLDRLAVEVRCALAGSPASDLDRLRDEVESCGAGFAGESSAFADLVVGSVHRARGENALAVDSALRGLAQLGWTPQRATARPLSAHLAAALLSQWLTALLDGGRVPAEAVRAVAAAHDDVADAGRQGVLLRLTLARAEAGRAEHASRALAEAAVAADAAGLPALVAACRTAQSELYEGAGRYREALEAMRAAAASDQVDRARGRRFRQAVAAALPTVLAGSRSPRPSAVTGGARAAAGLGAGAGDDPTAVAGRGTAPSTEPDDVGSAGSVVVRAGVADVPESDEPDPVGAGAPEVVPPGREHATSTWSPSGSSRGRGSAIDPDDPLGVSGLLGGPAADRAPNVARSPAVADPAVPGGLEGVRLSSDDRTGTRESGSPLGDALLAELRDPGHAADRPAVNGRSAAGLVGAHTGAPVVRAGDGTATGAEVIETADPAAPAPPAPPADAETAERSIVVDLVDDAGDPVPHAVAAGALEEVALRSRRLVPPSGTAVTADAAVRITFAEADRVTVRLWARSLATHLAGRVRRGGLPDGAALRLRASAPGGTEGEEIVRALTGPDDEPAPAPADPSSEQGPRDGARRAVAASDDDVSGPPQPATEPEPTAGALGEAPSSPAAGPAMSSPVDLAPEAATPRPGRRRAADGAMSPLLAAGITVRPGSGGRRRSDGIRPPDTTGAPDPARHPKTGTDTDSGTGRDVLPGGDDPGSAGSTRSVHDAGSAGSVDAVADGRPVDRGDPPVSSAPTGDDPDDSDRLLADTVRAHLELPDAGDGDRAREGLPVAWSTVTEGAGPAALPKRNGRSPGSALGGSAGADPGSPLAADLWTVRSAGSGSAEPDAGRATASHAGDEVPDPAGRGSTGSTGRGGSDRTRHGDPDTAQGGTPGPAEHGGSDHRGSGPTAGDLTAGDLTASDRAGTDRADHDSTATERAGTDGAGTGHDRTGTTARPDEGRATSADPREIPADMGIADLLAGALAAYREI